MLKALTGALALYILLAITGSHVFYFTMRLFTFGGKEHVLNMSGAIEFVTLVLLSATLFYTVGYGIWRTIRFLWSKF